MERTRGEIVLFTTVIAGIWISIWAVIFVSMWLEVASLILCLVPLAIFALRDQD